MPKTTTSVKKTATKKTTKKVAAKKVAKKVNANKKTLAIASNQKSFWVHNGQILNSLMALHNALDSMEKAHYEHHVGDGRNDFAQWVDSVLCDSACADDLRKAKTPKAARTAVAKHLKHYVI